MSESLSPSEVQSLFAGLNLAGGAAASTGRLNSAADQTMPGDQFTLPMSLNGDELESLQAWHTELGKAWSRGWTERFASRFTLHTAGLSVVRLRDFISEHTAWQGFQVAPTGHEFPIWVVLDVPLVAAHLDCLLGGTEPAGQPTPRSASPLEQQLTGRLVRSICESLPGSRTTSDFRITAVNSTADWIAGVPVYLACEIVQLDFELRGSGFNGHLSLAIPRVACDALTLPHAAVLPNRNSAGRSLQLRATLAPISLSPTELQELQVGDVLLISQGDQAQCLVSWDGQQQFTATVGAHQGHKAIRLTEPTTKSQTS